MHFTPRSGSKFDYLIIHKDIKKYARVIEKLKPRVIHCGVFDLYLFNFRQWIPLSGTILSGTAIHNGSFIKGPCIINSCPDGVGEWTSITFDQDGLRIHTDPFGTSPVFYGSQVASSSLILIKMLLEEAGVYRSNKSAMASRFLTKNSFSMQISTFATPIEGIYLLPSDSHIAVDNKIQIVKDFIDYNPVTYDEYWSLIEQGARDIAENVYISVQAHSATFAAITGGRDSRAIYGALLANGLVSEIHFGTKDIGRDLEISTSILKRFGGNRGLPPRYIVETRDVEKELDAQLCFDGYCYHRIDKNIWTTASRFGEDYLHLGGGSGEVYRGFYHQQAEYCSLLSTDAAQAMQLWIREEAKKAPVDPTFSTCEIENTIKELAGDTPQKKFTYHYLNFRNRFHFGNTSFFGGKSSFSALQSKALLKLSRRVPPDVLMSGRILFDVTKTFDETLAYHEYDKKNDLPYHRLSFHKPSRFDGTVIPADSNQESLSVHYEPLAFNVKATRKISLEDIMQKRTLEILDEIPSSGLLGLDQADAAKRVRHLRSSHIGRFFKMCSRIGMLGFY